MKNKIKAFNKVILSMLLLASPLSFSQESSICALKGVPPSDFKYKVVKKIKVAKGTYGGISEMVPLFSQKAKSVGAEAVLYYNGSERFGFFPWRVVRPVITGTAIVWDKSNQKAFPCTENGGFFL